MTNILSVKTYFSWKVCVCVLCTIHSSLYTLKGKLKLIHPLPSKLWTTQEVTQQTAVSSSPNVPYQGLSTHHPQTKAPWSALATVTLAWTHSALPLNSYCRLQEWVRVPGFIQWDVWILSGQPGCREREWPYQWPGILKAVSPFAHNPSPQAPGCLLPSPNLRPHLTSSWAFWK